MEENEIIFHGKYLYIKISFGNFSSIFFWKQKYLMASIGMRINVPEGNNLPLKV